MAWQLFLANSHRVKAAGLGALVGYELGMAVERMVAAGTPREVAEELLTACERAAVDARNEKDEADD